MAKPQQTDQEWARGLLRAELGRAQPQAGGLPVHWQSVDAALRQLTLGDAAQLPFPDTQEFGAKGTYKLLTAW